MISGCLTTGEITRRPLAFGRATTSLTDLPLVTNPRPRVKSARFAILGMPRSHVGVARFYDWSDHPEDCYPVSRLYREIACTPRLPAASLSRVNGQTVPTHAVKINLSPGRACAAGQGRMFFREKKALTRGEKEIIEGIYKNRGDASARDWPGKPESSIKNHQDAWQGDKSGNVSLSRVWLKGEKIDAKHLKADALLYARRPPTSSSDTPKSSSTESLAHPGKTSSKNLTKPTGPPVLVSTCLTCQTLQDDYINRGDRLDAEPAAPPSSPDLLVVPRHRSKVVPTFDKLLSSRASLQPTSILLADRLAALNLDPSSFPLGYKYEETNRKFDGDTYNNLPDHHCPELRTNSQSCFNSLSGAINNDAMVGTANWVLQCDKKEQTQKADLCHPVVEQRKFAVQIYVPTAGTDQPDDESPHMAGNSLAKERPLSHRTFKRKKKIK
ncbi:hypothetical protein Btru_077367 [Bulinus truncatus]|nr:hypothetical protein Btru_077367 [Bulinus truncatus]